MCYYLISYTKIIIKTHLIYINNCLKTPKIITNLSTPISITLSIKMKIIINKQWPTQKNRKRKTWVIIINRLKKQWMDIKWEQIQMALFIIQMITQQLVRKVTGEQDNQRVYKLDLCSKSITRIYGLKPFSKIRCLHLGFNRIKNIENLECLPDLRELHLEYNQLSQLAGLDNNKMLTVLTLSSNKIQKIQNIGHLIKLQTLVIDNNQIQRISGLQTLKDLKHLQLSNNKLTSIDSLPSFSKLQNLCADNNKIKSIQSSIFTKSTKLLKLSLAHNELVDISFVNCLISLEELNVSHNKIVDICLGPLKNLEILNVCSNRITRLPTISVAFPELSVFLFRDNQIISQFQLIQAFAQAQMLVQIDYRGNLMDNPNFSQTLYKVYGFDRINDKNYSKPGTRYINKAQEIRKVLHQQGMGEIQNDEQVRKIIMSGFYNDELETDMTGIKPDRPNSATKNKTNNLNYEDIQKSYHEIVKNQKRLQYLRNQCLYIFQSNGIKVNIPGFKNEQRQESPKLEESNVQMVTQPKNLADRTTSINSLQQLSSRNEDNINKWKQLKNRQKSFNIRGVVRKMSGSQRKSGAGTKQGSLSKIPTTQQRSQLMRTQLQPPRWNNDPSLMRTMQARPLSSKKK